MKKFLFVLCLLLLCLTFTALAEETEEYLGDSTPIVFFSGVSAEQPDDETATDISAEVGTDSDFALVYGNTSFQLGDDPSNILAEMEKEDHPSYVTIENRHTICNRANCSYENDDIAVMTDPDKETGDEVITAVFVDTEGIKTSREIGVGDHIRRVYLKYGYDYQRHSDLIVYKENDKACNDHFLVFQIDDNRVLSYALLDEPPQWYK